MKAMFTTVLQLGLAGSYAIVFVLLVRQLLRKAPKIFSYVLWLVVLFRLLCPISVETKYSVVPTSVSEFDFAAITEEDAVVAVEEAPLPQDYAYA